jgi:hypothetical protein
MRLGVLLIAVLLLAACGGAGRRHYVSRNEAVLASLPAFPKAVKTHEVSSHVKYESGSKPSGYTTTVVYRVPRGTTSDSILIFYTAELGRRHWQGLNNSRVLGFTKGRALVLVKPPFTGEHVYDVVVDYRGAAHVR